MQENSTSDQLIQYLYQETGVCETFAIEEMIEEDVSVREEYEMLSEAYRQMPKVKFSPSDQAIRNILRYSEFTALTEQA